MNGLVAIDWGTSSLRAALLDGQGSVVEERTLPGGILAVPAGGFPAAFAQATAGWDAPGRLHLVCGMAGSRQGWLEAPYCPCPAGFAQVASHLAWIEPGRIAIVPGMSCEPDGVPDVMRGEETQVFGALALLGSSPASLVLPGTHSKWVQVSGGRIVSFTTFMTGEIYALLRRQSILARTLPEDDGALDRGAFEQGVRHAQRRANLLASAFSARTLGLFDRLEAAAAPSYLSGLVIGEELRSQSLGAGGTLVVVGADALTRRYCLALELLGVDATAVGAEATWLGLWSIARALEKEHGRS